MSVCVFIIIIITHQRCLSNKTQQQSTRQTRFAPQKQQQKLLTIINAPFSPPKNEKNYFARLAKRNQPDELFAVPQKEQQQQRGVAAKGTLTGNIPPHYSPKYRMKAARVR